MTLERLNLKGFQFLASIVTKVLIIVIKIGIAFWIHNKPSNYWIQPKTCIYTCRSWLTASKSFSSRCYVVAEWSSWYVPTSSWLNFWSKLGHGNEDLLHHKSTMISLPPGFNWYSSNLETLDWEPLRTWFASPETWSQRFSFWRWFSISKVQIRQFFHWVILWVCCLL